MMGMRHVEMVLCACCFVAVTTDAQATPVQHVGLAERVLQSHHVVVAKVTRVQGPPPGVGRVDEMRMVDAGFSVERAIKGKTAVRHIEQSVPLRSPRLAVGDRVLLFLAPDMQPLERYTVPGPIITIGSRASIDGKAHKESTFRLVLLYLAASLSEGDEKVQIDCLGNLQDIGGSLHVRHPRYGGAGRLREALGDNGTDLKAFVEDRILPSVRKLAHSKNIDPRVRDEAILTAGLLNDAEVIPAIAALARGKNHGWVNPTYVLGEFRVRKAVKWLVPLLEDDLPAIRQNSASALAIIGDPVAIPFLLECLDDPELEVRRTAIGGLDAIASEPWPGGAWRTAREYEENEKAYLSFWRQWSREHKARLGELRRQFASHRTERAKPNP